MALRKILLLVFALTLPAAAAVAQPLGSFRWQLQPYCNVITVNVVQQGAIYQLDGTDDRCGGGNQPGSVVGIASLTPLGLVGFGLSTVLPNGTPIHTEATISIASLGGTWRDSAGNNGNFVFTPGAPLAGAPRPVPSGGIAPASITNIQIANNAVTGGNIVDASITSADIADGVRVAFAGGDGQNLALPAATTVVRSVTVTAPAAGKVIVVASGFFGFSPGTTENVRCEVTTSATTIDNVHALYATETAAAIMTYVPFGTTRGFDVAAGATTFNLLCDEVGGSVTVWRSFMTATYSPQ